ncbi:MAG: CHAT domain-containing protein [Thauera sp.]|nr:CHAT domain-containing protein [Thauera sp.]
MSQRSFLIRGSVQAPDGALRPGSADAPARITSHRLLTPGRARDGVTGELRVTADEIVRVELDNGFELWTRADALVREHGRRSLARDGGDAWEFDSLAPATTDPSRGERGLVGLGIRVLEFFGVRVEEKAASKLGRWFEDRKLEGGRPGLHALNLDGDFALSALADGETLPAGRGPLLIFLHGTASSTRGSFGKLWAADNAAGREARARLAGAYGGRAFAYEHRSLTESPVHNALELVRRLPQDAEVHLVSHSRGGLVGELLCLGECEGVAGLLDDSRLDTLFAADRTIAAQLGLLPLSPEALAERDEAYDRDREALAELLAELATRKPRVTRFARVACPARGTTLASGRLDRWLSMLNFLAGKALGASPFADALEFLLAVVKERTDPRTLPGLEAMMPGSALTRLLHHPELVCAADLSVIAGDVEGDSAWQKIKLLVTDWFYGADHDLVVNTGSMSGGLRRLPGRARFRLDRGAQVNHFSYFRNADSVGWLVAALTRGDSDNASFLPIAEAPQTPPRWRQAVERSHEKPGARPLAVVLPGTMGSTLSAAGRPVWLDYRALLRGALGELAIDRGDIVADHVIDDFYAPLIEFLGASHRVEVFAYDWRLSIREAAARLARALEQWLPLAEQAGQPVHLVAHSMGGLVVRAMIADGARGAALWERITRLPGSRLLMLGTPNAGSYEALRWLTGCNPTQARLALLDFTRGADEIVDLVRHYPGLVELLPFGEQDPDFSDPARWRSLRENLQARWETPPETALRSARETWALLRAARPDPAHMCYVAGCQSATIVDYQLANYGLEAGEAAWLSGRKRLAFLASREGDGTVSWASGQLDALPTWYLEDTAHDALCVQQHAFAAYLDLLQTGTTTRLAKTPPLRARAGGEEAARFELPATPPADGLPAEDELRSLGFGGGLRRAPAGARPAAPTIEISVRHGDLSYARHPVLVGHYQGDTIVSAEATLDRQLDHALSRRLELGLYPGRLDTNALFFNVRRDAKPEGAIVVGLGQVGELTPGLLEAGVRAALLDYALQVSQWPNARFGPVDGPRRAPVSCLLVGTGAGALTVRDSIEAIVRATIAANAQLQDARLDKPVSIDRLEFVELFADVAITAAESLRAILANSQIAAAVRWPARVVESGRAGCRRVRFDEAPEWWHRLEIVDEDGQRNALRFIFTTDRARAEETLATGQLALADAFIRSASSSPSANPEAARTLYEMLLPLRLKEAAPRQGDLVLLVDACSARYPWELLENRWSDNGRPPAVNAGLVRQLRTAEFRARPAHAFEARALVVGNPDLEDCPDFPPLPGAQHEAFKVAALLRAQGWLVDDCIDQRADKIIERLHGDAWRILHLAGHGEHEHVLPPRADRPCSRKTDAEPRPTKVSGMVIGRDIFLTPGDIEQMRWVPELVFINCCHLGKAGAGTDRGALAANLGMQFIRMGVRAVVAAGWAVDDAAALAFADAFYRRMLDGEAFGEAVRAAREEVWLRFPGVNTWGAYQCYGDPAFSLQRNGTPRRRQRQPFHAPDELVVELDNLTQWLRAGAAAAGRDEATAGRINALLARIPDTERARWLARADVAAALGFAWGEARFWEAAIEQLERALTAAKGNCPMRAVEQLANFRVRLAAEQWQAQRAHGGASAADAAARKALMQQGIDDLELLCGRVPSTERLDLLGSAYKRSAVVAERAAARLKALDACAAAYWKSFELGREAEAYPFTNWASAVLLAQRLDPGRPDSWRAPLALQLARLPEALRKRYAEAPDFWDGAALADLELVRLLDQCLASAPPAGRRSRQADTLPAECATLAAQVGAGYRRVIGRGASPRERASVIENLDCLIALLGSDLPALRKALAEIRDGL